MLHNTSRHWRLEVRVSRFRDYSTIDHTTIHTAVGNIISPVKFCWYKTSLSYVVSWITGIPPRLSRNIRFSVEVLLSLRVSALYGRSRRIRCLMGCTATCLFTIAIVGQPSEIFISSSLTWPKILQWLLFGQKSSPAQGASGCHISISEKTSEQIHSRF